MEVKSIDQMLHIKFLIPQKATLNINANNGSSKNIIFGILCLKFSMKLSFAWVHIFRGN